jgi:hypothetical protein
VFIAVHLPETDHTKNKPCFRKHNRHAQRKFNEHKLARQKWDNYAQKVLQAQGMTVTKKQPSCPRNNSHTQKVTSMQKITPNQEMSHLQEKPMPNAQEELYAQTTNPQSKNPSPKKRMFEITLAQAILSPKNKPE